MNIQCSALRVPVKDCIHKLKCALVLRIQRFTLDSMKSIYNPVRAYGSLSQRKLIMQLSTRREGKNRQTTALDSNPGNNRGKNRMPV